MSKIKEIAKAVENGQAKLVARLVQEALSEGCEPTEILNRGMVDAMGVIGEKYNNNEIFVPEMLAAARVMKKGVEVLKPYLAAEGAPSAGKMILGTVAGDLHDIGKSLVGMMIKSVGFEVIDLGIDVPVEKFIRAVKEHPDAVLVGCSALLTTTLPALRDTVAALNAQPFRSRIKIMVGGAPVTQAFADEIGADGYSENAASAAELARKLAGLV